MCDRCYRPLSWKSLRAEELFLTSVVCQFFPQLIAGPIVRYETVEVEIRTRNESICDVAAGFRRFIRGLAKKVLIANTVALLPDAVYAGESAVFGTLSYWLAPLGYTLQIYYDFSGYSDMAIGLGRMFGFHFQENFDCPYVSRSITEFWRRWHISLSTWFRDYIYIPLGGNRVLKRRWMFNYLVVWIFTGFWHGAQWNFVLWGVYYAALLLLEKTVLGKMLEKLPSIIRWLYTFFFVNLGWVLFDRTEISDLFNDLHILFCWQPTDWASIIASDASLVLPFAAVVPALLLSFPIMRRPVESLSSSVGGTAVLNAICLLLFVSVCIMYL